MRAGVPLQRLPGVEFAFDTKFRVDGAGVVTFQMGLAVGRFELLTPASALRLPGVMKCGDFIPPGQEWQSENFNRSTARKRGCAALSGWKR